MRRTASFLIVISGLAFASGAAAQEGARFHLREHARNAGGSPVGGTVLTSARFRLNPSAIGDAAVQHALAGGRFRGDGGFAATYPAPGEVLGIRFAGDGETLSWDAERSAGHYNVYRDLVGELPALGFGACHESSVADTSTIDPELPAVGTGFFYLVTAANRLQEEGTKGHSSTGAERGNAAPCP